MRVALVHDWLTGMRGGEKVLSLICQRFPNADLFTLIYIPGSCDGCIEERSIRTSFLNAFPRVGRYYRYLLPLMPFAMEQLSAGRYDLIISSSHCVAKGIGRSPGSFHLCYCHTPMRYVWDPFPAYVDRMSVASFALRAARRYLRAWDRRTASRVDAFVANSQTVAHRIWRVYRRRARVVYPPVDTAFYTSAGRTPQDFYLMVTALVPYKRVDQAIEAFNNLGRPLRIIGSGPLRKKLEPLAKSNVTFLGWQTDEVLREHYRSCRALVFPGEEDFGVTPVEAMACGAPVIAYGAGGVTETVLDMDGVNPAGPTGLWYRPQTAEALAEAVCRFEQLEKRFQPDRSSAWANRFGQERFLKEFNLVLEETLEGRGLRYDA